MIETPKDVRDQRRGNFIRRGNIAFFVEHRGVNFTCFLLKADEIADELLHAVAAYVPTVAELRQRVNVAKESLFAIDERVPEAYRRFCILHEIIKYLEVGVSQPGYSAKAAEEEITLVRSDRNMIKHLGTYARQRADYFARLVGFAEGNTDAFRSADVRELRHALHRYEAFAREVA